jgi:hypothetical protein
MTCAARRDDGIEVVGSAPRQEPARRVYSACGCRALLPTVRALPVVLTRWRGELGHVWQGRLGFGG